MGRMGGKIEGMQRKEKDNAEAQSAPRFTEKSVAVVHAGIIDA